MHLNRRFFLFGVSAFFFVCLFLTLVFYLDCCSSIDNGGRNRVVFLPANTSSLQLVDQFKQWHWIRSELTVNTYLRLTGLGSRLHAGKYWFRSGMSIRDLLIEMSQSKGMVTYRIQITPGATFVDILHRFKQSPNLNDDVTGRSTKEIKALLHIRYPGLEGLFSPDTYQFVYDNKASLILRVAYKKMQINLSRVWRQRDKGLPYKTPYQLLIAASLIEAESRVDEERPLVASVLVNRLRKNMRLQFDPTVLYGLHRRLGGRLSRKDLARPTPFNTYKNKGLPPTPIDAPGLSSLQSAAHPAQTDYMYFVLDPSSKLGAHVFSRTLSGHDKAVKNYVKSIS